MKARLLSAAMILQLVGLACGLSGPPATSPPVIMETSAVITDSLPTPEEAPTLSPQIDIEPFPPDPIWIEAPGPLSRVTSPVIVSGIAQPTFEQTLIVMLTDASGNILAIQPTHIQADAGKGGLYQSELAFDVAEEQPGRVSVYDVSPRDGGIIHLSSVPIMLLPAGQTAEISAPPLKDEAIFFLAPDFLAEVSGGELPLNGFSQYFFEANLSLILCGEGGRGEPHPICGTADNILAEGYVMIDSADIGQPGAFNSSLLFSVSRQTYARLVAYGVSPMDGGIEHLNTIEIVLNP